MAKENYKKGQQFKGRQAPVRASNAPSPSIKKTTTQPKIQINKEWYYWLIPIIATLILYIPSLFNDFITNWDDGGYIHQHELIHKINWKNFYDIFFNRETFFYKGNYHPLTTFFYAIEYQFVGTNAFLYHFNNMWIHLINVFLVFKLIRLLKGNLETAGLVALLFGIHPMHVESVAWISERKDVLYAFFFLLSLIYYIHYILKSDNSIKRYGLACVFFLLSLMSKSAAVSLPGLLILLDIYFNRKFDYKFIIDKAPFFVLSLIFGIIAVKSQDAAGAIQNLDPLFTPIQRFFLANYATMRYLIMLFVPINLSGMHPYPQLQANGNFDNVYYIAPFVVFTFLIAIAFTYRKTMNYVFGVLFFFITIALMLQIIPVGGAIIAERYTYIPYIGLFFAMGKGLEWVSEHKSHYRKIYLYGLIGFSAIMMVMSFNRIPVWKRGDALFSDVIEKYPNMPFAYDNLGYYYYTKLTDTVSPQNPYDNYKHDKISFSQVEQLYTRCLTLDPNFHSAYSNRGVLFFNIKRHQEALADFDKALKIKPSNKDALLGAANTLGELKRFQESIPYYEKYLLQSPKDDNGWMWLAIAYSEMKKSELALVNFNKALALNPANGQAYYKRGLVYYNDKKIDLAIADFKKATELLPQSAEIFTWLAWTYYNQNKYELALKYFDQATSINPRDLFSQKTKGHCLYKLKRLNEAAKAYSAAISINPNEWDAIESRAHCYYEQNMYKEALADMQQVKQLGQLKDIPFFNILLNKVK